MVAPFQIIQIISDYDGYDVSFRKIGPFHSVAKIQKLTQFNNFRCTTGKVGDSGLNWKKSVLGLSEA